MLNNAYLALMLDAPMQSWGLSSRFQRRTSSLFPTKSAVVGMLAAAMGINKYAIEEKVKLSRIAKLQFTVVALPKQRVNGNALTPRRITDYHTVEETINAGGKPLKHAVISHREYLCDTRFGVLIAGEVVVLDEIARAVKNPKWGVWFGRKSCIPATPLFVARGPDHDVVWQSLLEKARLPTDANLETFARIEEANDFSAGTDTLNDQPTTFSSPNQQVPRRVHIHSATL